MWRDRANAVLHGTPISSSMANNPANKWPHNVDISCMVIVSDLSTVLNHSPARLDENQEKAPRFFDEGFLQSLCSV